MGISGHKSWTLIGIGVHNFVSGLLLGYYIIIIIYENKYKFVKK